MRLERDHGSPNKDLRPGYAPGEASLDAFVDLTRNVGSTRRATVIAKPLHEPERLRSRA